MLKKITSVFMSAAVIGAQMAVAFAASPKATFNLDCNTQEKQVSIGFQSNPDDPANGPEIIALKFTYVISPEGTSTFDDVKAANLVVNPAYSNFIVAENKRTEGNNSVELKLAGGFTGGTGMPQAADLAFIKGINQKTFKIIVQSGELYPKNNNTNIYQNTNEQFIANPASCAQTTTTQAAAEVQISDLQFSPASVTVKKGESVKWINKGTMPHTVTSTSPGESFASNSIAPNGTFTHTFNTVGIYTYRCDFHQNMTASINVIEGTSNNQTTTTTNTSTSTTIQMTSNKSVAKTGDAVEVTAIIKNRNGKSVDWSQTTGSQIQPEINNEELGTGETKSVLKFNMVATAQDITLKVVVGDVSETIKISNEEKPAAETSQQNPTGTQTPAGSLQERLAQRREELNANATPTTTNTSVAGNIHGAAEGLSKSGPEDTLVLMVLASLLVLGWRKMRRSEVQIDV